MDAVMQREGKSCPIRVFAMINPIKGEDFQRNLGAFLVQPT
jgi:hypothetical protein